MTGPAETSSCRLVVGSIADRRSSCVYLLDTNVISELRRVRPHGAVLAWLRDVDDAALHISVVTVDEIQAGIELTRERDQSKAAEIEAWLDDVSGTFNVIDMDGRAFRCRARMMHRRSNRLIEDAMIAATAHVHNLTVVARNLRDFQALEVPTFDPLAPQGDHRRRCVAAIASSTSRRRSLPK